MSVFRKTNRSSPSLCAAAMTPTGFSALAQTGPLILENFHLSGTQVGDDRVDFLDFLAFQAALTGPQ